MKHTFKNFNLLTIQYPFTAIISFLHRVSGILLFLLIPFLLFLFGSAFGSDKGFSTIKSFISISFFAKAMLWLILSAMSYHLFAGIRHLLMDIGWGEHLKAARVSGAIVLVLTIIFTVFIGIWLW